MLKPNEFTRGIITGLDTLSFLQDRGFPILRSRATARVLEAIDAAKDIGFPVALKIWSPDIIQKTDVKGVLLNLQNESDVQRGFKHLIATVSALLFVNADGCWLCDARIKMED